MSPDSSNSIEYEVAFTKPLREHYQALKERLGSYTGLVILTLKFPRNACHFKKVLEFTRSLTARIEKHMNTEVVKVSSYSEEFFVFTLRFNL
jgi:hypothetical protein